MANFDFKSPFNMLDTPYMSSASVPNSRGMQLSEYLINNGGASNLFSPLFCPSNRLNSLFYFAELKKSKLIMMTDPQGEQFVLYERTGNEEFDEDNYACGWQHISFQEIIILVLERLKKKNGVEILKNKQIVILKSITLPLLLLYCEANSIEILDTGDKGSNIIMHIDYP